MRRIVSTSLRFRWLVLFLAAATLALGFVLVAAGTIPGHKIEHPMAVVILGGLVTSTLLNLFVLPSLYLRFGKSRKYHRLPPAPSEAPAV